MRLVAGAWSTGQCWGGAGGFYAKYAAVQGSDQLIPVDVFIPWGPPRPEAILSAVMKLQERIDSEPVPKRGMGARRESVDDFTEEPPR